MRLLLTLIGALLIMTTVTVAGSEFPPFHPQDGKGPTYFANEHDMARIIDAVASLSGQRLDDYVTRQDLAGIVASLLDEKLPPYGVKSTPQARPEVPQWFTDGYRVFNPTIVAHSRYLDSVMENAYEVDPDIAALYAAWCAYDAEWFILSRHADYKAWLSAVMLQFPHDWYGLRIAGQDNLHMSLVVPLQTPDEPYREIDNWIGRLTNDELIALKSTVRNALVEELLMRGGMLEYDERYFAESAYTSGYPTYLGLTAQEFYLLAALSLEFSQELNLVEPASKQALYFRDYFVQMFYENADLL